MTMSLWRACGPTDPEATRSFKRPGGFSGTAISPMWLVQRATETFGPMGIAWGVQVLDDGYFRGETDEAPEAMHWCRIRLWYDWQGNRGSIEHYGCTTVLTRTKRGTLLDEEAPKKSLTDAMSKALSLLGFGADVHMGRFDDNKYVAGLMAEKAETAKAMKLPPQGSDSQAAEKIAEEILEKVKAAENLETLNAVVRGAKFLLRAWETTRTELHQRVRDAVTARRAALAASQ